MNKYIATTHNGMFICEGNIVSNDKSLIKYFDTIGDCRQVIKKVQNSKTYHFLQFMIQEVDTKN